LLKGNRKNKLNNNKKHTKVTKREKRKERKEESKLMRPTTLSHGVKRHARRMHAYRL
jgi:hypothetical protein